MAMVADVSPSSLAGTGLLGRDEKLLFVGGTLAILAGAWVSLCGVGSTSDWSAVCGWLALGLVAPLYLRSRDVAPFGRVAVAAATVVTVLAMAATLAVVRGPTLGPRAGFVLIVPTLLLAVPGFHFVGALRRRFAPMSPGALGLGLVLAHAAMLAFFPVFTDPVATVPYMLAVVFLYAVLRRCEQQHYAAPVRRAQSLSVTLITKNEEDRVTRCLDSVAGWADEIIVLDSQSSDKTAEIARRYTDKVWVTDWPGYGPQKQRALEKASCAWVLSIDADEELTPELRHDIDCALGPNPACVGYKLPWGVVVYGQLLDFGRSARAPLRLFRREGSRFTDAQVHETIVLPPGAVGRFNGRLLHYTQRDFGHALAKNATYGWLGARQRYDAGKRGGGLLGACLRSMWVFVQVYIIRLGILDGRAGFLVAALYAQGSFNKYAGLWALRREHRQREGE